jgi:catechol 2,3-dioxygenase-like lactoylglutathione lyase family enzyme
VPISVRGVCSLLQVFDMPTSVRFYRDLLGFEVIETSGPGESYGWALLRLGDAELMLNTAYEDDDRPPAPDPVRLTGHADTTLFFGCPDLDAAYEHLCGKGVTVEKPVTRAYGMRQLYVSDPDGYGLCFQWPAS